MEKPANYFSGSRIEMLGFLPETYERVLEIGCGEGNFARQLKVGAEIWGVEPDARSAQKAREHLSHVLPGLFDEVRDQLPRGYFDVVICNDVIEHMVDHDRFLRDIQHHMKPGSSIVASVPNLRHIGVVKSLLFAKDFKYEDSGIMDRTHLRFFTERSLRRSVEAAGFHVERLDGINALANLFRLSSKRLLLWLFYVISLGGWRDMRFQQLALRATRPGRASNACDTSSTRE